MSFNDRCNVNLGAVAAPKLCGQPASNWCYNTSGPKTHNHNVCDDHWDSKKKNCVEPGIAASEPQPAAQRKSSGGGNDRPTPKIRPV